MGYIHMVNKIKKKDILIFLIIVVTFSVFLYIFAPGILSYDSYNQLNQINTSKFSNWHPFFHTFIELVLLKLYNSPISIALFQIIVFSIIWTIICRYNDTKTTNGYIFQIIVTLIICFNPLNFLYAITLWKDILFSYVLLFVCFLIQIIVEKQYECKYRLVIVFGIFLSFLAQLRYNGLYISIIIMVIFSVLFYKKSNERKNYILLPIITIVGILMISALNIIYDVKDNDKNAVEPKVMQYLTYYLKQGKISKEEKALISKIANIDELKEKYNYTFTDPIYSVVDHKKYNKYKKNLLSMTLKYSIKYPDKMIYFAFKSTSFVWNPLFPKDRVGLIINTDINSQNNTFGIKPIHQNSPYYIYTNKIINKTLDIDFIKVLLYSPALYLYLSILIGFVLWYRKKYKIILIILPNLINLLLVALSNPIQDVRYIYPNILVFYLVVIILINKYGGIINGKNKKNNSE